MKPSSFRKSLAILTVIAILLVAMTNLSMMLTRREYMPPYGFNKGASVWSIHTGYFDNFPSLLKMGQETTQKLRQYLEERRLSYVGTIDNVRHSSAISAPSYKCAFVAGDLVNFKHGVTEGRWFTPAELALTNSWETVPIVVASNSDFATKFRQNKTRTFFLGRMCQIIGVYDVTNSSFSTSITAQSIIPAVIAVSNTLPSHWLTHNVNTTATDQQEAISAIINRDDGSAKYQMKVVYPTNLNPWTCLYTLVGSGRTLFLTLALLVCLVALFVLLLLECFALRKQMAVHRQCGMRISALMMRTWQRLLPYLGGSLAVYLLVNYIMNYKFFGAFIQVLRWYEAALLYGTLLCAWFAFMTITFGVVSLRTNFKVKRGSAHA